MRSAYATVEEDGFENEQPESMQPEAGQEPPPTAGPAQPTAAEELQLLQAQLQNLQQERDRIAAAYAANQEAALAAAQATEIRQQLSILQAEILSMQPPPQPTIQPTVLSSVGPTVNVQPTSYGGALRTTLDLRSLCPKDCIPHPGRLPTS